MNIQLFKNRNGLIILTCALVILLIYLVDIFKLAYQMTSWQQFGEMPIEVGEIQSFTADTPNVIGYKEPGGEMVSCAETVAYVQSTKQETYRCCDTGEKISCLPGNFSEDIIAVEQECLDTLRSLFALNSVESTKGYRVYGTCSSASSDVQARLIPLTLTVIQLENPRNFRWKFVDVNKVAVVSSAMRCILVPFLFAVSIWIVIQRLREQNREPIRRF